jgi:hypothetical protein
MSGVEVTSIVGVPEVGLVRDLPFDDYMAVDAVSSSQLRYLAEGNTLAHLKAAFIEKKIKKNSKALDFGRNAHLIILEPRKFQQKHLVMPDFGAMQSSINRKKRDDWLAKLPKDVIPVSEADVEKLSGMMNQLLKHKIICNILSEGAAEVSIFWVDKATGLRCKARADFLAIMRKALVDYKTTRDAFHDEFTKDFSNHGYAIQLSHYKAACVANGIEIEDVLCVAQESEYPYLPIVYSVDPQYLEDGEARRSASMMKIAQAKQTNLWPGYEERVHNLTPPPWQMYREVL